MEWKELSELPRQKKRTVDYFSHDCKHGKTMKILENRYGNDGYAFWFKLLEFLGDSDGHYIDFSKDENAIYLSSKASISEQKCEEILNLLCRLEAIDQHLWEDHNVIWSSNFVKRLEKVYEKRSGSRPEKPRFCDENPCSRNEKPVTNGENVSKTPQSKEKESKEKESKEDDVSDLKSDLPPPTPKQFQEKWKEEMPPYVPMHLTDKRRRKLRARRKEDRFVDNWKKIVEKASQSDFLVENSSNGTREKSFFDATWLLKNEENYTKLLEGKYDDQEQDTEEFGHLDSEYSENRKQKLKEAMT